MRLEARVEEMEMTVGAGDDGRGSADVTSRQEREAIQMATERYPEHTFLLGRLSETEWAMRLYADAHAALKEQYRTLAADYVSLLRERNESRTRSAVTASFVGQATDRLQVSIGALREAAFDLRDADSGISADQRMALIAHVTRLQHAIEDLCEAVGAMEQETGLEESRGWREVAIEGNDSRKIPTTHATTTPGEARVMF